MNRSTLLTILGAAVLSGIKKRGSSSNPLNTMLKVGGVSDGLIHFQAIISYQPMADWRNQASVAEFFFSLHEHINPAIKLLKQLKKEAEGTESPNILKIAEEIADSQSIKLWYYSEQDDFFTNLVDRPENLPLIPLKMVDVSHIESKKYNDWDLTNMMVEDKTDYALDMLESAIADQPDNIQGWLEDEGFDWIYEIVEGENVEDINLEEAKAEIEDYYNNNYEFDNWQYEQELDSLIELHEVVVNFVYDPSTIPVGSLRNSLFESEIKQLMLLVLNLYHGNKNAYRDGDDIRLGNIRDITIKPVIPESSSKSQLRSF